MKYQVLSITYRKGILLLLLIPLYTLYFILHTGSVHAESLDLAISPPIIQITTDSPVDLKTPFTIENLSNEPVIAHIYLQPFKASEAENGSIEFLKTGEQFGDDPKILDKIRILEKNQEVDTVEIAPKQDKTLVLQIRLPKNEPASDYYFSVILLKSIENQNVQSSHTQSTGGIGMNVLLTISGKIKATGTIEEFSAPWILERGPVPFTVRVKNQGSHVMAPTGSILITNMYGQQVGKVNLQPVNVLSESIRSLPDSNQSEDKQNSIVQNTTLMETPHAIWPEQFLLGPYTARLTVKLSDNEPILIKDTHFIGLPVQAVLAFIILIIVLLIVRERVKKHLKRK